VWSSSPAHAFGGVGRGVRNKVGTYQVDEVMAYTLRIFVRTDGDMISVGGTGKGTDTALVLRPATSAHLFDLRVREVICKPSNP
jgi:hypothetical protein